MFDPVGGPLYSQNIQIVEDISVDLFGVVAIDSTVLGPAAGGCRLWAYTDHASIVNDAVQLARGMSLKNAMAGLPLGAGKAVLKLPDRPFDRRKYFEAFGKAVAKLNGNYITAEDVGGLVTVWFRSLVYHYANLASKAKGLMPPPLRFPTILRIAGTFACFAQK